jgi:hypothetical protein
MPEIGDQGIRPLLHSISDKSVNLFWKTAKNEALKSILNPKGLDLVGAGSECVVVRFNNKPGIVTAFNYDQIPPEKAKETFYLQRIVSTLFPHNFPHIIKSSGTRGNGIDIPHTNRQEIIPTSEAPIKYPFQQVLNICNELHIPIAIDMRKRNFIQGEDGGEYNVDPVSLFPGQPWDSEKIINYMNTTRNDQGERFYDDKDVQTVNQSLNRLLALGRIKFGKPSPGYQTW